MKKTVAFILILVQATQLSSSNFTRSVLSCNKQFGLFCAAAVLGFTPSGLSNMLTKDIKSKVAISSSGNLSSGWMLGAGAFWLYVSQLMKDNTKGLAPKERILSYLMLAPFLAYDAHTLATLNLSEQGS